MFRLLNRTYHLEKILAGFIVTLSLVLPAHAATFSDVAEQSQHFAAIEYLKSKGIVSGYPDKTFQPQKSINRAEALKILFLATKIPASTGNTADAKTVGSIPFSDLKKEDWFYEYVKQAVEKNLVQGYPDKTFRPHQTINLAESVKVILTAFHVPIDSSPLANTAYPDVAKDSWYASFAHIAKIKSLLDPSEDGKFHPEKEMSREAFAEIVYRLLYIQEAKTERFPIHLNWPKFGHPTDHYSLQYPFDWQKIEAGGQIIFWKQDVINGQVSFSRIFPNGATVIAVIDQNTKQLTLDQYLAKIQYDVQAEIKKQTINNYAYASVSVASNGLRDFYFSLPNKSILILYSQNGDGLQKAALLEKINAMVDSVRYEEKAQAPLDPELTPRDLFLSKIRTALLVKNKGQETLALFKDQVIIDTDTIGIGTGPIDYYFSPEYNVTVKYERESDTLLALKDGKTSAF